MANKIAKSKLVPGENSKTVEEITFAPEQREEILND